MKYLSTVNGVVSLRRLVLISGFLPACRAAGSFSSGEDAVLRSICRSFPGDALWPSQREWSIFNVSVNGRLVATVPIGSPCHSALFNAERCAALQANWNVPETHARTSHSVMAPFWANRSCDPFAPKGSVCIIGTYVQYAVNVTDAADIQKTIEFARDRNLRLLVRNTGHDYFGKSTGAGALAIWTHNLKSFSILDYKSPYYTGKAAKVGAGIQIKEAYSMAHEQGLTVVGGNCPTVGLAGGYTQGGGHGFHTSKYGFGADQVLEWDIIMANGSYVKANPLINHDLYWALCGGGGGTFGVAFSMTVKAYPEEVTSGANLTFTREGVTQESFYTAVKSFHSCIPALSDLRGGANWVVQSNSFMLIPAIVIGATKEQLDRAFGPTLQVLSHLNISYTYSSTTFPSFFETYEAMVAPSETAYFQIGGRLIPRSVILNNSDGLIAAINEINTYGAGVSGLSYRSPVTNVSLNSVNPMLRTSEISFSIGTLWSNTDWDQNLSNQALMTDTLVPLLGQLTPGHESAYLNEGDPDENHWQEVFYGENYDTLWKIKEEFDPDGLLWGRTAVGSEKWIARPDGRLCQA